MRGLREQPRLAAARVVFAVLLIAVGVALGAVIAGGGPDSTTLDDTRAALRKAETDLQRQSRDSRNQAQLLEQARADLRAATRRSRALANTNNRLRRQLRRARARARAAEAAEAEAEGATP
jgi:hypothetical protein